MTTVTFETTTCSRCGGTGHYSFNQMTGTACFKCNSGGRGGPMMGKQFSRAGAAARKAYDAAYDAACRQVPVASLQPGDRVLAPTRRKATVVSTKIVSKSRKIGTGPWICDVVVEYLRTSMSYSVSTSVTVVTPEAHQAGVDRVRRLKGATITEEVSA